MISDITRAQLRTFRSSRRAWISFLLLVAAFALSLLSEQLANDRPLVLRYAQGWYFPTLHFYPGTRFGGEYATEADYRSLRQSPEFAAHGGWMLLPPIPHDPLHADLTEPGNPPHPPSSRHWLGTDNSGRDVAARLLYGFRTSMTFALTLIAAGGVLGIALGGLQGYLGGKVDLTLQRIIEIWSALPFLYVVILIGSLYGQSFATLVLVFALFEWIGLSYYMRGEFLRLKNQPFVLAARALGQSHFRILFRHLLPNALNPVITVLPFTLIGGISSLTALDFLGFGLPPPAPSWGEMLQQALQYLYAPWLAIASVSALFITLLLAGFVGEGVRAAFDPKVGSRLR